MNLVGFPWHEVHRVCNASSMSQGRPGVVLPLPPSPDEDAALDVTLAVAVDDALPALELLYPPVPSEVCPPPGDPPQATAAAIATGAAARSTSDRSCLRARDPESTTDMIPPMKLTKRKVDLG